MTFQDLMYMNMIKYDGFLLEKAFGEGQETICHCI